MSEKWRLAQVADGVSGKGLTMTEALVGVSPLDKAGKKTVAPAEAERSAVRELVKAARARGDDLTGRTGC